jgi:GT2 family glycosyltransferase
LSTEARAGPDLGVVLVSHNTCALLDRCLITLGEALAQDGWQTGVEPGPEAGPTASSEAGLGPAGDEASPRKRRAEVWVVDNASTDGSAAMVRRRHPWVRLAPQDRNLGFTAGNNVVLRRWLEGAAGRPEWVLLLNPDTELAAATLPALRAAFAGLPDAAVVGPALAYPDGSFQHAAFRFPGLAQTWLDLVPVDRLADSAVNGRYPRRLYEGGQPFAVDFVLGACMLVRGAALAEVGILDEGFFMYCEEIDWCRRFRAAGWRSYLVPGGRVLHHGGASSSQVAGASFVRLWQSRQRYFAKHGTLVQRLGLRLLLPLGFAVRAWGDRRAEAAGRVSPDERRRRAAAYREILAPPPP